MTHLEPEERIDRLRILIAATYRAGVVGGILVDRTDLGAVLDALDRARDMRDERGEEGARLAQARVDLDLALDDLVERWRDPVESDGGAALCAEELQRARGENS